MESIDNESPGFEDSTYGRGVRAKGAPNVTLFGLLYWAVHRINYYVDYDAYLKFENAIRYTQLMREIREHRGQSSDFSSSASEALSIATRVSESANADRAAFNSSSVEYSVSPSL
jgi:hypothetical protein